MPTIFIHTGLHKTGTTSLQKTFFDKRRQLARQGVLYPRCGLSTNPGNWGHHGLAEALRSRSTGLELWQALRKEADEAGLPKLFVSSETLSLLPFHGMPGPVAYRLIAQCFEGYDIKLICYLRPQAEMIASLYNHNVKAVGERRDIIEFMAHISPRLDYQNYLNVAVAGLGQEAILVRRYQKSAMADGDVVTDVAGLIGVTLKGFGWRSSRELNRGLNPEGLAAMLAANRRFADDPVRLKAERRRIIAAYPAPPFGRHELLSDETRATIEALYRRKNLQIARKFLNRDDDLFSDCSEDGTRHS